MFSNLPTDNLYKFMALAGLAIFVFMIYFSFMRGIELREKMNEILLERSILKVEITQSERILTRLKENQNPTVEEFKDLIKIYSDIERRSAILEEKTSILNQLMDYTDWLYNIRAILFIVSLFLTVLGFLLWYYRIQRYQDKALQNT
jgi:hypothetical protein